MRGTEPLPPVEGEQVLGDLPAQRCPLEVRLLDGFELRCTGETVPLAVPTQRVVALLALRRRSLQREFVAETLWGDRDAHRSAGNLRSALWRLRDVPGLVQADRVTLRLGQQVEVDVLTLESLARRLLAADPQSGLPVELRRDPVGCARVLDRELLPDWYEDWTTFERERLRELRLGALEQLSHHCRHLGLFGLAVDAALAAIRTQPLREAAHAALVEAHLAAGNRAEALRRYEALRRLLEDELGLAPSLQLRRRIEWVLWRADAADAEAGAPAQP